MQTSDITPNDVRSFFAPRKVFLWLTLLVVIGVSLAIRLYDLKDLPLDFQPTRQLHSILMARGMYYQHLDSAPVWQRDLAVKQWKLEGLIEPPFMEWLTAQTYQVIGSEQLWVARIYSILFWMLGGLGIFLLVRELAGLDAAVIGMLYFLILPYGAIASRAFQPDPLMTALIVFTWWSAVRWWRSPTWKWTLAAGLLGGAAILIKSVALFFIAPVWIGLVLAGPGLLPALRNLKVWVIAALSLIPYAAFMYYGLHITGELVGQFSLRFFPSLWKDPVFYLRWNGEIASTVGFEWFLVALLGAFLVRNRVYRIMFLAVWIGYFAYGLSLPYHMETHDYYQLPLIPLVAVGVACAAGLVLRYLRGPKVILYALVIGLTLFAVTIKAWDVRVTLKRTDFSSEPAFWQKLGQKLGHDKAIVGLTQDYGYRLEYWGWVDTTNWMNSGDFNLRALAGQEFDMKKLFDETVTGKDYFVVTMLGELDKQPALKSLLYKYYPILEQSNHFVIFDLKHPKIQPAGS